jgi:hypothetical protein
MRPRKAGKSTRPVDGRYGPFEEARKMPSLAIATGEKRTTRFIRTKHTCRHDQRSSMSTPVIHFNR